MAVSVASRKPFVRYCNTFLIYKDESNQKLIKGDCEVGKHCLGKIALTLVGYPLNLPSVWVGGLVTVLSYCICSGQRLEEEDTDRSELALPGHQLQLLKDAIYYSKQNEFLHH